MKSVTRDLRGLPEHSTGGLACLSVCLSVRSSGLCAPVIGNGDADHVDGRTNNLFVSPATTLIVEANSAHFKIVTSVVCLFVVRLTLFIGYDHESEEEERRQRRYNHERR